ncbi:EAL domain-containing protein [Vibrio sp. ZSDE26]|uniref:EAL domain-containing protein n=1 Tax=Vibrio amylolyticus TaxID=2847292 RepID=A0A9X1XJH3_9VIBR|nr:EAL domain-containing protein [Vibrio amylolyticus]MCK6264387.1 EAL domain-containing protein [Vibrio amylolyticus]
MLGGNSTLVCRVLECLSNAVERSMRPFLVALVPDLPRWIVSLIFTTFPIFSPVSFAEHPPKLDTVELQLRWHHQFQFAGYYAAVEQGFYAEEGLNVILHSGDPDHQPVSQVLSGEAQYAEGNSEVLYHRLQGEPLVALAAIFQHSPSILLTLADSNISSVHDLIGKKVMLANQNQDADFLTMLLNEKVSLSQVDIIPSSYQLDDLISGKTDAFNSYSTNEPFYLDKQGITYNIIDPINYRVDFYSDILFTTEDELRKNPRRVQAMLRATLKGWRYAMNHTEEVIDLLINEYQVPKSREHLRFEASAMRKLIIPDLIPVGNMNPERWQHMADTFVRSGLVENDRHLDGFVYDPSPYHIPKWMFLALASAFLVVTISSAVIVHLHRLNLRLAETKNTLLHSEERFKALSAATYGGLIIHQRGRILECNNGLSEITGFDYSELIGMNGLDLIATEDLDTVLAKIDADESETYEVHGIRKDGSKYPISMTGKEIIYKGAKARVVELIDISERKRTEEQLKLAASVFTHAKEGIIIVDSKGIVVDVNETFSAITGYSHSEIIGRDARSLKSDYHDDAFYYSMRLSLTKSRHWSGEIWNRRKNGEVYAELMTISVVADANGITQNYVALFSDITSIKQQQKQLEHIAHYDVLTNLPNRILLAQRLKSAMKQSDNDGTSLAVAYLDLDGFKAVNDTHGHDIGDELLVVVSKRMNETLRDGDTLARIGGDEFVIVLIGIENIEEFEQIVNRLLLAAKSPIAINKKTLQVSASIGVTFYPQDQSNADQLMRHADQAMYSAKQLGKNRYHLFDIYENQSIKYQYQTIERITQALEKGEFTLHYQPKVNMETGAVIGAEALIRWQHPQRGLLFPDAFLPIIDNHPISLKMADWVIDNVLTQMEKWRFEDIILPVSVNIDAFQLQQKDFVSKISDALKRHPKVCPKSLQLEILETSALSDITEVLSIMKACMDLGISFALDDFGTGFSSLTYLKQLPAKVLKIDQTFVRDMLDDADDRAIVMGVISLATAFNRQVTAEGVETIEHGTQLLKMGCVLAQGHGISPPLPADEISGWIEHWAPDEAWVN